MAALKGANKVLLAALGGAVVLVIAAIVLLAITLGKTNNLNTVAATPPASQPCSQNTIEAFYFAVISTKVNYTDTGTTSGFMNAMQMLQAQINDALTNSAPTSAATTTASTAHAYRSHETVFDANKDFMPPVILGIGQVASGIGVTVMASTVFTGTLPGVQDITNRLTSGGLTVLQVNNGTQSNTMNQTTQMCQQVGTNPSGATTTTTTPLATSPLPTSTPSPTTPPPTTTSTPLTCPSCSCSTIMGTSTTTTLLTTTSPPATSTTAPSIGTTSPATTVPLTPPTSPATTAPPTSPTSSTTTAPPTSPTSSATTAPPTSPTSPTPSSGPVFPCVRDITILIDCSSGLGNPQNYRTELTFISQTLISQWTVSPTQVEADAAIYDSNIDNFVGAGNFNFNNVSDLQTAIFNFDDDFFDQSASIKTGLQGATGINGYRNGTLRVLLLFTSTSIPNDVIDAQPYADQLKSNGNSLIVIGLGPFANANILQSLASGPNFVFSASSYDGLQGNTMLASQINAAICATPPTTTSTTTTTTTTTTTPIPPSYPCMKDILILMDGSSAMLTPVNYISQLNFLSGTLISNWTVSPAQVEANPAVYDGIGSDFVEFGSFSFQNTQELMETIISADAYFVDGPPSLKVGLQVATSSGVGGYRPGVPAVTLLFTASSDAADVNGAMPYAAKLKSNGNSLITIGMGQYINMTVLAQLASGPNFAFYAADYTSLPSNVALANQINSAICLIPPTTTPGPTTTSSSTITTTGPTTTAPSTLTTPTTTTTVITTPTTTVTTTTVTTTTQPLLPMYPPCKKDVLILIDNSLALLSKTNYQAELDFISKTLIANWTVNLQQVEADPAVYNQNPHDFTEMGSFGFSSRQQLQASIALANVYFSDNAPSITIGLQESAGSGVDGWRAGIPRVTLLFTAQSDAQDVNTAMPFAAQLKSGGNILITIGLGKYINMTILSQLASGPNFAFSASDYLSLPNNNALANQINGAICLTPSTTTAGPTTTTTTTTAAPITTTSTPPSYPCLRDVTLLMDISSGLLTSNNCQAQLTFISSALISNWTVSLGQIEAAPAVYDSQFLTDFGAFTFNNLNELQQIINAATDYCGVTDAPSITYGLSKASDSDGEVAPGRRAGVLGVTVLFTSTSDPTDVGNAMQYAGKLKTNGSTLIVVAMGNANSGTLTPLASGSNFVFTAADYTTLATNTALASQINMALCMPASGSTPAATTPAATTPAATTSASTSSVTTPTATTPAVTTPPSTPVVTTSAITTPASTPTVTTPLSTTMQTTPATTATTPTPPSYPCLRDVTLLVDVSSGLTGDNCQAQVMFISSALISNWTVSLAQIEAAPAVYDSQFLTDIGAFAFNNLNELQQAINSTTQFCGTTDAPSITNGLSMASDSNGEVAPSRRAGILGVTVLFTSTSDPTDVGTAMQYANKLKTNDSTLIVVAMGNANSGTLTPLASGSNFVFTAADYTTLATNTALASQINMALCMPASGSTPAATTPAATTPAATTPASTSSVTTPTATTPAVTTPPSTPAVTTSAVTTPSTPTVTTPLSTTMQTTPATTATTPTPPSYPCLRDVTLLMDVSSGLTGDNCQAQVMFISSALISNWTVSLAQIEAAPAVYDSQFLTDIGAFAFNNLNELQQAINSTTQFCGTTDAPSITNGLSMASDSNGEVAPSRRAGILGVTVLFTSTSDPTDVGTAMQYAGKLKTNGSTLIVVAMGNANSGTLTPLASGPNFVFTAADYTTLATNIALASQINTALCMPASGSTPAVTTPAATTPAATTPAPTSVVTTPTATTPAVTTPPSTPVVTTPASTSMQTTPAATSSNSPPTGSPCTPPTALPNVFPCQANILLLFDGSGGLNSSQYAQQTSFIGNQLFNASWTFQQLAIGEFDDNDPTSFQPLSPFNFLNNLADAKGLVLTANQYNDNPASITVALQQASTLIEFPGAQPCISLRTILFTSTSATADVATATTFATQLKTQGTLIIVGMGSAIDVNALTTLASPNSFFPWPDYGTVPSALASNIIHAFRC